MWEMCQKKWRECQELQPFWENKQIRNGHACSFGDRSLRYYRRGRWERREPGGNCLFPLRSLCALSQRDSFGAVKRNVTPITAITRLADKQSNTAPQLTLRRTANTTATDRDNRAARACPAFAKCKNNWSRSADLR